jgi:hypothetical protein
MFTKVILPVGLGVGTTFVVIVISTRRRDEALFAKTYGCLNEVPYGARQKILEDLQIYRTSLWRPVLIPTPYHLSEVFAEQKSFSHFDRGSGELSEKFCRLNGFDTAVVRGD